MPHDIQHGVLGGALSPSLDRSRHSLTDEVAFARSLSPEERLVVLAQVCKSSYELLKLNRHRERLLTVRDPVPPSTLAAWRSLSVR